MTSVRRVVTGRAPDGRDCVLQDEVLTIEAKPSWSIIMQPLWGCSTEPTLPQVEVPALPATPFANAGEVVFNVTTFPPSSGGDRTWGPLHATESVDFVVVLEGELCMRLEGGEEVVLRQGTCLVQTGTAHAWLNRSAAPARLASVMLGARRDGPRTAGSSSSRVVDGHGVADRLDRCP